ncbi:MAG TPA: right-handed parallel beta-helix repeat-containing protein [Candidatus Acidoferrum sp.]|nr:right-handed parallel beta-helix repeat-containing protein [Candidatus Acidoferrum sp.]
MPRSLYLLLFILALPLFTAAQVTVIHVPADVPDIQSAINQAAAIVGGATPSDVLIEVAPGTYNPSGQPSFNVNGVNNPFFTVTLRAAQGAMVTILDASNIGNNVIRGFGIRNLVIDGFTIRNRIADQTNFVGRGIVFGDSTNITVQNCNFDDTFQGLLFRFFDTTLGGQIHLIHNTGVVGQGTDQTAPGFVFGQVANLITFYPAGANPTGEPKFIVEHNVFRSNASVVRYINQSFDVNGNAIGTFFNGSLEMTGNDLSSSIADGFNIIGGHGHLLGANRIHDGGGGGLFQGAASGIITNNLIFNNGGHALVVTDAGDPAQGFLDEGISVLHNTIVNNAGTGILYIGGVPGVHNFLPDVYNNILAFNDAGGVASIESDANTFAFIPVSFNLAANDNYGNTLRNFNVNFFFFPYIGISNPSAAAPNYSGVLNTGLDLAMVPGFRAPQFEDFSLMANSPLVNAGIASRPTPFEDFFGHLRDSQPDIGAFEFVTTPNLNVRNNPNSNGRKLSDK